VTELERIATVIAQALDDAGIPVVRSMGGQGFQLRESIHPTGPLEIYAAPLQGGRSGVPLDTLAITITLEGRK
jgi:hypothetical protein